MLQYSLYQWGGVRFHWISLPPWYHGIFVSFSWKQLSLNAACSCRFWWNYQRNEPCLPNAELGRKREPNCGGGASGSNLVDHLDPPNTKRFKDVSSKDRRWQEHLFYALPSWWCCLSILFTCCYYSSIRLFMVQGWTFLAFSQITTTLDQNVHLIVSVCQCHWRFPSPSKLSSNYGSLLPKT